MAFSEALTAMAYQRRAIRFSAPGPQLRLAATVLGTAAVFGLLLIGNSYAAYADLFEATLALTPESLVTDIATQTHHYLRVSAVLLVGMGIAVAAVSAAALHRVLGPLVAIERQVRALNAGNYSARIALRGGDRIYAGLAQRLNDLAQHLERDAARR